MKTLGNENHLIILGGGSAAFSAAIEANRLGVKVTMINDGLPIGGTCVNVGCVPSKNLIRSAETIYKANHNPFEGVKSSAKVNDFHALIESKEKLVQNLREEKYINIIKDMQNFELVKGYATFVDVKSVQVGTRVIQGTHILICNGASPMIADIKGLNMVDYLTNKEAFELEELPESLIVLGGSYIALEVAQMFSRLGSKVTILQRSQRILSTQMSDITDELSRYFKEEGISIVTGNAVQSISQNTGHVDVVSLVNGSKKVFTADKIVVATGRRANTKGLNLEKIGIELERNQGIKVDEYLQTTQADIYAAGDVLGKNMFVYTAAYEAKVAINNMFSSQKKAADFSVLPWVIFTDPQVAGVGMDELQAEQAGLHVDTAMLPLSYVPRALAARDTRGFIKLVRNIEDDTLVGARILAPEGSELLMEVAVVMKFGIKVEELKEMLHPYLTLSEGIKLAAITFTKSVKELSCCAT